DEGPAGPAGGGPPPFGPFAPPRNAFDPPIPQDITNGFDCDVPPANAIGTHFHVGMEYLQWWLKQPRTPPLVTTGSLNDAVPGTLTVYAPTRMYGADANVRWTPFLSRATGTAFTFLTGVRFLALDDKLVFDETIGPSPGTGPGTQFALQDNFTAHNRFYGAQV